MDIILNQFSNRLVRDLAWVIASPPLVSGNINNTYWWEHTDCLKEFNDCLSALKKLDSNPHALIEHLDQLKSKRLGMRFEGLVAYWLLISPNYQLISKNIQLIEDGITYGEIDFIIKDLNSQKNIHLEVAVKFYLGSPPYEDSYRWFGTNTKDQLGKKLDHLKNHQTQLSKIYKHKLTEEIDEQHCLIKGRLFYPSGVLSCPKGVTSNHLRGSWVYTQDVDTDSLLAIGKEHWLAELEHTDICPLQNNPEVLLTDRAQCFVDVQKNSSGEYQEVNRVFCLPTGFDFPE